MWNAQRFLLAETLKIGVKLPSRGYFFDFRLNYSFNNRGHDFCECEKPKNILYTRKNPTGHEIDLVWPGSDRVRFLDNLDRFQYAEIGNFHIVFHICTGLGEEVEHSLDNGFSWSTWEYVNPFQKEYCFVEPRSMCLDNLADFEAIYYDEEEFYELLSITANRAKRERNNKANATGTPCHK